MEALSKEVLELIQETAVKANGATAKVAIVQAPGEPSHINYFVGPDGAYEKVTAEANPRRHIAILDQELRS